MTSKEELFLVFPRTGSNKKKLRKMKRFTNTIVYIKEPFWIFAEQTKIVCVILFMQHS